MSYRSIKRVLGETSLERKCRFLFGACLLLLIAGSFWWYGWQTEQIVNEQNRDTGFMLVVQDMQVRHWRNWDEKYRTLAEKLSASFSTQSYKVDFIIPSRAGVDEKESNNFRPADDFERNVLEKLSKAKPRQSDSPDRDEFSERMSDDGSKYHYYQAIRAQTTLCFDACHKPVGSFTGEGAFGRPALGNSIAEREGDLMAVAKLTFSTERTQDAINKNRAFLVSIAIITVMLAMIASYLIVRYVIVKPLRHLRDVSDSISRGDISLRADIHTGDEFEELAVAFNRMLRHLTTIQEELRQVNANLDGKVDELAQVNMRLYELNMLKSDFLATMSHELRTPLNSILGFSEVLESIDSLDEKQKRYVQNIQKSGRSLLEMINDILDLAKIESGKMDTRPGEFRIAQLIATQCDLARPLSEKKNIDLRVDVQPDLPPMRQDQARVQQILNNLLSNAIKFTPEGGWITVSAERYDRDFLVLKVSDTGIGIAEEDRQAIFEKFRQGRTAMPTGEAITREHSGTGLGLSIVKELCKLLGGEVSVESELGKGSTFTVRLPWSLPEQTRLDSAVVDSFAEFSKSRLDLIHHHRQTAE